MTALQTRDTQPDEATPWLLYRAKYQHPGRTLVELVILTSPYEREALVRSAESLLEMPGRVGHPDQQRNLADEVARGRELVDAIRDGVAFGTDMAERNDDILVCWLARGPLESGNAFADVHWRVGATANGRFEIRDIHPFDLRWHLWQNHAVITEATRDAFLATTEGAACLLGQPAPPHGSDAERYLDWYWTLADSGALPRPRTVPVSAEADAVQWSDTAPMAPETSTAMLPPASRGSAPTNVSTARTSHESPPPDPWAPMRVHSTRLIVSPDGQPSRARVVMTLQG